MQFLAPSLLLGLLAAISPWLIHRIGKRRANPVRFAAMELLLRAERKVSARRRPREILLGDPHLRGHEVTRAFSESLGDGRPAPVRLDPVVAEP